MASGLGAASLGSVGRGGLLRPRCGLAHQPVAALGHVVTWRVSNSSFCRRCCRSGSSSNGSSSSIASSIASSSACGAAGASRRCSTSCHAAAGVEAAAAAEGQQQQQQQPEAKQAKQQKQKQQQGKQQQKGGGGGKASEEAVTPKSEDFSRWYLDVVAKAELADYGPVRGTMVIRPYGYAIWESIQGWLDARFKETGHQNAYFPQLIPYSFITKEAEHVEGFAPELALVTQGGGKELEEPLVVRPTSETIINHMFAQWVQSYRDLPLLLNQWCNVHRWEMRTRPFVRTLEFLWQEGHTAHATPEEAEEEAMRMIRVYEEFAVTQAAIPVIAGRKSRLETFAGAATTYTIEAMMGDKKALQAGTSHNLGDNFARAFNTQFVDEQQQMRYVHQSSWGVSTRLIGGVIMAHGDDKGLRLPPNLAPIQVVVVPIVKKDTGREAVDGAVDQLTSALKTAGIRVKVDGNDLKTPGWRYNYWELKGVPLRVEVGPRDVEAGTCVLARRDVPGKEGKQMGVPMDADSFVAAVRQLLGEVQAALLSEAAAFRDANIVDVSSYEELKAVVAEGKWARGGWAGTDAQETQIKEETQATLRCFPFDQPAGPHTCFMTGQPAQEVALFAKSY